MKLSHKAYRLCLPVVLVIGIACALCLPVIPSHAAEEADILFQNGVIYTADAGDRTAESLAVRGGRIAFVGSNEAGAAYLGSGTKIVDLGGKLMLPGFVDSHIHSPGMLFPELFDFDINGIYDADETMEAIRIYIEQHPDQKGYFGFGYATNAFAEGPEAEKGPRRERLDEICRDKPVVVFSNDSHQMWMNTKAFQENGITSSSVSPAGGVIELDETTGELWGVLKDMAMSLGPKVEWDTETMKGLLLRYQELLNSLGTTSILSVPAFAGIADVPWEALAELEREGALTIKVHGAVIVNNTDDLDEKVAEIRAMRRKYKSDFLKLTTAKFFADGVVNSRTAYMLDPYEGQPENRGHPLWTQGKLNEAFARINEAGLQTHIHAVGDAAVRMSLDANAYAAANAPRGDCRNVITHLQVIHRDDLPRFAELGVIANIQPYWHFKEPYYWESEDFANIGERAETEYPLKSLVDAGANVAFSSDSPVPPIPNTLIGIEMGVTRNLADGAEFDLPDITDMDDPTYLLCPAERLPVKTMIRGFTIDAAYSIFSEAETGSLEVGKAADMIILNRNILEIDPLEISNAEVVRTYLNGVPVYDKMKDEEPSAAGSGCNAAAPACLLLLAATGVCVKKPGGNNTELFARHAISIFVRQGGNIDEVSLAPDRFASVYHSAAVCGGEAACGCTDPEGCTRAHLGR